MSSVETKTLDFDGQGESAVAEKLVEDGFESLSAPTEQRVFSNPPLNAQASPFNGGWFSS